jgi:putative hydrolase of the HAD superfamily
VREPPKPEPPKHERPAAVLFDLHDTLVHLWPSTDRALAEALGVGVEAFRTAWSRVDAHVQERNARGQGLLAERDRWPYLYGLLARELGLRDADPVELAERCTRVYTSPSSYRAFEDAGPVLEALARAGMRLAVVSNSDFDLWPVLRAVGLAPWLEAAVPVLCLGVAKPQPEAFAAGVAPLGVDPRACWFVGDHLDDDIVASSKVGMRAVLVDRAGRYDGRGHAFPVLRDLRPLPGLLRGGPAPAGSYTRKR